MTTAFLSRYLEANLIVAVGYLLSVVGTRFLSPTDGRRFATTLLFLVLFFPLVGSFLPNTVITPPKAQVWSGVSIRTHKVQPKAALSIGLGKPANTAIPFHGLAWIAALMLLSGTLVCSARYVRDLLRLRATLKAAFPFKSRGSLRVVLSEEVDIPFAYRSFGTAYAVLPVHLLEDLPKLRLALRHELQHHRQGDTISIYWLQLLKLLYFWNPFSRLWELHLSGLQEFACDEVLISRRKVSPRAYGGCLLKVAETALRSHRLLAGTAGMAVNTSGAFLKRRVEAMFQYKPFKTNPSLLAATLVVSAGLLACTAFGARGLIKDRRITLDEARGMAANVRNFPVNLNEDVLHYLNRFLGTPDGRRWVRESLTRMENHREIIERALNDYNLPWELMGVPFIESGFVNKKPHPVKPPHGAGIWQFIPGTARNYQLKVDPDGDPDERLDVVKETDAAMRYLRALNDRFLDWRLAVMGYNAGENRIQRGINATGSKDPWELMEAGFTGDEGYLPKLMAAILILRNPEKVE